MFYKKERTKKVIDFIVVQRVNSQPSGKLKKYEPLDARDFVDFSNYDSLTLNNVKEACENFYAAPSGSCNVLYSDRGPVVVFLPLEAICHHSTIKFHSIFCMLIRGGSPSQKWNYKKRAEFSKDYP